MPDLKEKYYEDLYKVRLGVIDSYLKIASPQINYLQEFPWLIERAKADRLTDADTEKYKKAYNEYKDFLNQIIHYAISDMFYNKGTLDLSNLFKFVIGGGIGVRKFSDHITNKCFSHLFSSIQTPKGINWKCNAKDTEFKEGELIDYNNFDAVRIIQTEKDYLYRNVNPPLLYLFLAFTFNYEAQIIDYSKYLNQKDSNDKKFYVFVDMFEEGTACYALKLDEDSVYTDVFFRLYLDEIIDEFKKSMKKFGSDFKVSKEQPKLYDPNSR